MRGPGLVVLLLLLLLLLLGCAGGTSATEPGPLEATVNHGAVAFTGVGLVSMLDGRARMGQTVVVVGDRIVAVGPDGTVPVPDSAVLVAGQGRYLMPGLLDMHVHVRQADLATYVESGITSVRNMWGYPALLTLDRGPDGGLVADSIAPTIYSTSPGVDASPGQWPNTRFLDDPSAARAVVDRIVREGWLFVKVYSSLSRAAYDSLMAAARAAGIRPLGHVPFAVSVEHALAEGQYSIEHLTGYDRALSGGRRGAFAWAVADLSGADSLARLTRDARTWNCPTSVVLATILRNNGADHDTELRAARGRQAMIAALHRAGAGLLAGTDAGIDLTAPGTSLHDELDEFVASGLTPYEALRAATVDAAAFLGVSDRIGTIRPGLRADLLLVDGNPLDNVDVTRRPLGVMLRGRWLVAASR